MPSGIFPNLTDTTARALLVQVRDLGYFVSVHHLSTSLLGSVPASIEMHAVDAKSGEQHLVKTADGDEYQCACELARMVGIDLKG